MFAVTYTIGNDAQSTDIYKASLKLSYFSSKLENGQFIDV